MRKHMLIPALIIISILVIMACNISSGSATPDQTVRNTQIALAKTQTAISAPELVPSITPDVQDQNQDLVNTQVALALTQTVFSRPSVEPSETPASQNQDHDLVNTQVAMAMTQTAMSLPPTQAQQSSPTPQDVKARIKSANILVYEDIAGDPYYIPYAKRALMSIGGNYTYVADAMGTFMNDLNSGTKWDLIISASELRTAISGDYWTIMKTRVDEGAALIAEIWYLDGINAGKIAPLLSECGVKLQADWQGASVYNPIDYGMYWVDSNSPVFNTPNQVNRFGASLTDPAWMFGDIGDLIEVTDSSRAQILATHELGQQNNYGLLTSCLDGRVLFQTFSSHNYPTNEMIALWENYIYYTLTNHFQNTH